jgi:Protein of unknown function (DUF4236)
MGWSLRKSLKLLPGIRFNLSRSGPRLSIGLLGARASIGVDGKANIYAGKGPLRYRKTIAIAPTLGVRNRWSAFSAVFRRVLGGK